MYGESFAPELHSEHTTGFPQALEITENLENPLKKVPCMEKSWNLKKPE